MRLVVLVAPVLDPYEGSEALLDGARVARVPVLRPVASGSFGPQLYRDGFHLNDEGAAQFTDRLIPALAGELRATAVIANR